MIERQAVEALANQVRRNRAPRRCRAAQQMLRSEAALADNQAESIRVDQRKDLQVGAE